MMIEEYCGESTIPSSCSTPSSASRWTAPGMPGSEWSMPASTRWRPGPSVASRSCWRAAACSLVMRISGDQPAQVIGRAVGEHAVAEIEDVARTAACRGQHLAGLLPHDLHRGEQDRRVEVALDALAGPDALPGLVQGHT